VLAIKNLLRTNGWSANTRIKSKMQQNNNNPGDSAAYRAFTVPAFLKISKEDSSL
jgi:hypothetical protein